MPMVSPHTFQLFGLPVNDLKRAKDFYLGVVGLKSPDKGGSPRTLGKFGFTRATVTLPASSWYCS